MSVPFAVCLASLISGAMRRSLRSCLWSWKRSWTSVPTKDAFRVDYGRAPLLYVPSCCRRGYWNTNVQCPYTGVAEIDTPCVLPSEDLLRKVQIAVQNDDVEEALEVLRDYKRVHGLPSHRILNSVITSLSYASHPQWLCVAHDMVLAVHQENRGLLSSNSLSKLALIFARNQEPIHASSVLRIVLESGKVPPVNVLTAMFLHMGKSSDGSYLASEILIEIYEGLLRQILDRKKCKQIDLKHSITLFNVVLDSCAKFKYIIKAQRLLELISRLGIVADANTIVILSKIFALIGRRDELVELKVFVDSIVSVSSPALVLHYQHFYHNLLSIHFMYNDINAASQLLCDLYREHRLQKSSHIVLSEHFVLQIGSANLKSGFKIAFSASQVDDHFAANLPSQADLVYACDGRLIPTDKAIAKLILSCLKAREVGKISEFLKTLLKENLVDITWCSDVVSSCIEMGWLVAAHDIIDDVEAARFYFGVKTYLLLFRAYKRLNQIEECENLLEKIRKLYNASHIVFSPRIISDSEPAEAASVDVSKFTGILVKEVRVDSLERHSYYELNNTIFFFCQSKMMEDALKTLKCMKERRIWPTSQTYSNMLVGYMSLQMDRKITVLWGDIKRAMDGGTLTLDRELLDCVLESFLRGGYFGRAMEVISFMLKNSIYCDQWKYRKMFLVLHKNLYQKLMASDVEIGPQRKRIEDVHAFRSWAGIH